MISYHIFSPGGNITALVQTPVEPGSRITTARKIMAGNSHVEQVGFILPARDEKEDFFLEMMGEEFCVNAARSAALLHAKNFPAQKKIFGISGIDAPIEALISEGQVRLVLPSSLITDLREIPEGQLVDMQGIRFIVTEGETDRGFVEKMRARYDDGQVPAIGVVCASRDSDQIKIDPWVWVRKPEPWIHESAWGSGSLAACFVQTQKSASKSNFFVRQPSGSVYEANFDGVSISLKGQVDYLGTDFFDHLTTLENYCPYCLPTKRKSHWDLHVDFYTEKIRDFMMWPNLDPDWVWSGILNFFSLVGLVEFVKNPDETQIYNRSLVVLEEARKRGIEVEAIKIAGRYKNEFRFRYNGKYHYFEANPLADVWHNKTIDHKYKVKALMMKHAVPVPEGKMFISKQKALVYAQALGFPLVVKPATGSLGYHSVYQIKDQKTLENAIDIAQKFRPDFILEKHIYGDNYRATVIGNKVFICRKELPNVVGDGA